MSYVFLSKRKQKEAQSNRELRTAYAVLTCIVVVVVVVAAVWVKERDFGSNTYN